MIAKTLTPHSQVSHNKATNEVSTPHLWQKCLTGFSLLFLTFMCLVYTPAIAQDGAPQETPSTLFTVENVETDVTSDNAVKAREIALKKARKKAFSTLAERLLSGEDKRTAAGADDITISSLISSFEVLEEKLSDVRYIATINVTFDEDAVKSYFFQSGDSFTTSVKKPVLILPWYGVSGQMGLWGDNNPWAAAWNQMANSGSSIVPFVMPIGDITDMRDYPAQMPLSYDDTVLQNFEMKYGVDDSIIAIAQPQGGVVVITLHGTESGYPRKLETLSVTGGAWDETVYKRGVEQVLAFLRSDWKNKTAVMAGHEKPQQYKLIAKYSGLQNWVELRSALEDTQGIEKIQVNSVSPQQASITLNFKGDIQKMALLLEQSNIGMIETQTPAPMASPYQYQYNGNGYYEQQRRHPQQRQMISQYEIFISQTPRQY